MVETNRQHFSRRIREISISMVHRAKSSHIAGALSMADILTVLYGPNGRLNVRANDPHWANRDRFILSKGHSCCGLYAALRLGGFISEEDIENFTKDGARLMAHASSAVPGIELSTGSLGHGLPVGCGLAIGARRLGQSWRTIVLLSDGELDEGSNWEAFLFAAHHKLNNLWAIIDFNKIQSLGHIKDVLGLEPLAEKFRAFNWNVIQVPGHDLDALHEVLNLNNPAPDGKPTVVIADTIKGKGVDFMEDKLLWHYRPPSDEQFTSAMNKLAQYYGEG
jgi:transketolase